MIRELALFAGGGGGLLASELLGFHTVAACEIDPYARKILLARQRDGMLGEFPIWDDVRTFDGRPWRGSVDLISGGFPCKDISAAGRGAGLAGKNSGLFFEMLRIIKEVRPRFVFAENSPNLRTRGLVTVVQELDRLGYECRWCVLGAWHVGAPHKRNRMWVFAYLADSDGDGKLQQKGPIEDKRRRTSDGSKKTTNLAHSERPHCERGGVSVGGETEHPGFNVGSNSPAPGNLADSESTRLKKNGAFGNVTEIPMPRGVDRIRGPRPTVIGFDQAWNIEPKLGRVAHGVADRVDRLKALGNGQVPAVACLAWQMLTSGVLDNEP